MKCKANHVLPFILVVMAMIPSIAFADSSGWYGTVSLGATSYGNSTNDENSLTSGLAQEGITSNASVDDNATGWALGVGYKVNPYFAIEGSYIDLGTSKATINTTAPRIFSITEDAEAKGETIDLAGFIPLSHTISLFGKFGLFDYKVDDTLTASIPEPSVSSSGTTYDIGVGVDFTLTQMLSLRAGLTQFHGVGDENTTGKTNIGLAYAQLAVNF